MSDSEHREQVEQLAEEFVKRYRAGEKPKVGDYARAHPELAAQIEELFPALVMMEELAPSSDSLSAAAPSSGRARLTASLPEQIGDYRIVREIGRGGMGVVYEALQQSLNRRVALKLLSIQPGRESAALARFRREARAAAQLHHTNIVPVFEVGQTGDVSYYAMQLILGQGLDEVLRELQHLRTGLIQTGRETDVARSLWVGRFAEPQLDKVSADPALTQGWQQAEALAPAASVRPANQEPRPAHLSASGELSGVQKDPRHYFHSVARIGRQVAEALTYAHARGIIHRDIKPSNLLLDTAGVVWVTDFGLAKTEDQALTETGDLLGTLRYMSPERFRGECDVRADVYALGLTLYELLVLRPAFDSSDRLQLMDRIAHQEPARPRSLDPRIPRDLETIVLKAIAKDPARRYQSAAQLAEDLRRFAADEPIRARQTGVTERLWRWSRRNPLVASLLAALVLVFTSAFALVTVLLLRCNHLYNLAESRRLDAEANLTDAQTQRQTAERNLAEAERQREQAAANFAKARAAVEDYLTQVSESQLLAVPGMQELRRDLLQSALKFWLSFLEQRNNEPELRASLAAAYLRVGKIQQELGKTREAREAFGDAGKLYVALLKEQGDRPELTAGLAEARLGRTELLGSLKLWEELVHAEPDNAQYLGRLAETLNSLANNRLNAGDQEGALKHHQRALEVRTRLAGQAADNPLALSNLGGTLNNIANILKSQKRTAEALAMYQRGNQFHERAHALAPQVIQYGRYLAITTMNQGGAEAALDQHEAALKSLERSVAVWEKLVRDNPAVAALPRELLSAYRNLEHYQRRWGLASTQAQTGRKIRALLDRLPHDTPDALFNLAMARAAAAKMIGPDGAKLAPEEQDEQKIEFDQALETLRKAVQAGYRDVGKLRTSEDLASLRTRPDFQELVANLDRLAQTQAALQDKPGNDAKAPAEELARRRQLLDLLQALTDPASPRGRAEAATNYHAIGLIQTGLGKFAEAEQALAQAEKIRQELVKQEPAIKAHAADLAATWIARGTLHARQRRLASARSEWRKGLDQLERLAREDSPNSPLWARLATAEDSLGQSLDAAGLWAEAADYCTRALLRQAQPSLDRLQRAAALRLAAGDREGYRQLCAVIQRQHGAAAASWTSAFTEAHCLVLGPNEVVPAGQLIPALRKGVEMAPGEPWRQALLALACYRAGQVEEAVRQVEAPAYPHSALHSAVLALAHHRAGHAEDARDWLRRAEEAVRQRLVEPLAAAKSEPPAEDQTTLEALGLYREARAQILGGAQADDPWLLLQRARACQSLGDKEKAQAAVDEMDRLAPRDSRLWLAWAQTLARLEDHDEAARAFARCVAIDPKAGRPLIARAHYRLERGDRQGGEADLLAAAATVVPRQEFVDAGWWLAGPYPADFAVVCPPEKDADPTRPAAAVDPDRPALVWKQAVPDVNGQVDFQHLLAGKEPASVYALTLVAVSDARTLSLGVSSAGPRRVWVNGRLAFASDVERPWTRDIDRVQVTFRAGVNTLLVRVTCGDPHWKNRFRLRLEDHPLERALVDAHLGLWPEAAGHFAEHLERGFLGDNLVWYVDRGHALLGAGDRDGYRRLQQEILRRFGVLQESWGAAELAFLLLAGETMDGPKTLDGTVRHAEPKSHLYPMLQLLHLYRTAQYQDCLRETKHDHQVAFLVYAMAAQRLGKTEEARRWLQRAQGFLDGKTLEVLADGRLGWLPLGWQELAATLALHAEALRLVRSQDAAWNAPALRGRALAERGRHEEAVKEYARAVQLHADEPGLLLARARSFAALKQAAKAKADLDQSRPLLKDDADGLRQVADVTYRLGDLDRATADCIRVLERTAKEDPAWQWMPRHRIGFLVGSHADLFERVSKLRPADSSVWLGRARDRVWRGQCEQAAADYPRVTEVSYFSDLAFEYAAVCLSCQDGKERYEKVRQEMNKKPKRSDGWEAYVTSAIGTMAPQTAEENARLLDLARQALRSDPRGVLRQFVLCLALYRAGQFKEAIQQAEFGLKQPDEGGRDLCLSYWLVVALAHQALGDKDKAREWLTKAEPELAALPDYVAGEAFRLRPHFWPGCWLRLQLLYREAKEKIGK